MSPVEVPGSKVSLHDWRLEDFDSYSRWLIPGHRWQQLDGPYYAKPSAGQVRQIVARKREAIKTGNLPTPCENLAIALRESGEFLGMVTRAWESRETNWLTVASLSSILRGGDRASATRRSGCGANTCSMNCRR